MKRTCSKCGAEKAIDEFVKDSGCRAGRSFTCKECRNLYNKKWKKNDPNHAKRRRELYAMHYGHIARENERKRAKRKPLLVRCQMLRSGMIGRARKHGVPIDKELFTTGYLMERLSGYPLCECCGVRFGVIPQHMGRPYNMAPSIDRIDPKKGYVEENVAILCWRCNNLKRDSTSNELMMVAEWMKSVGR